MDLLVPITLQTDLPLRVHAFVADLASILQHLLQPLRAYLAMQVSFARQDLELLFRLILQMDTYVQQDTIVLKVQTFDRPSRKLHVQVARLTASREPRPAQTAFHVLSIHMQTNLHQLSVIHAVILPFPTTRQQRVFAKDRIALSSLPQGLVVANPVTLYTKL